MRSHGIAEFVREYRNHVDGTTLVWLHYLGGDSFGQCFTTNTAGQQAHLTGCQSGMDIISDTPLPERRVVVVKYRYGVVDSNGSVISSWIDREMAVEFAGRHQSAIGIAELPAEIEVELRQP